MTGREEQLDDAGDHPPEGYGEGSSTTAPTRWYMQTTPTITVPAANRNKCCCPPTKGNRDAIK